MLDHRPIPLFTLSILMMWSMFASAPSEVVASRRSSPGQVAWTPEFTLRIQVVGYEDLVIHAGDEPADELLRELTVPITTGIPFKRTLNENRQTLSVSGKVTRMRSGQFRIDLKCSDLLETGAFIYDESGQLVPEKSGSTSHSTLVLQFRQKLCYSQFTSGGGETRPDGTYEPRRSNKRFIVCLEEYREE